MQNVEEQRLQNFRILVHVLEVKALEGRKSDGVSGIVEGEPELAATYPLGESFGQHMRQGIGKHFESAQGGVNGVEVFDLLIDLALGARVQL